MAENLYVHFPFCRQKCSYCALYSRAGVSQEERDAYARRMANEIDKLGQTGFVRLNTVYFGGGTPALCDLRPVLSALEPRLSPDREFTVELHPLDVTADLLKMLRDGGVNRISMGVQSLNDAVLVDMGRGYTIDEAARAFALVKTRFDNAGIDLIVGYPGDEVKVKGGGEQWNLHCLEDWGLRHCSVYSLQNERGLKNVSDDDWVLDRIRNIAICLGDLGLERYEISNYAVPGFECRHNLAVWRGEDYLGLGEGAYGRIGLKRTVAVRSQDEGPGWRLRESAVSSEEDLKERTIFRLRTRDGLDASRFPQWGQTLERYVQAGLLTREGDVYRLTDRGREVCDSILVDLV